MAGGKESPHHRLSDKKSKSRHHKFSKARANLRHATKSGRRTPKTLEKLNDELKSLNELFAECKHAYREFVKLIPRDEPLRQTIKDRYNKVVSQYNSRRENLMKSKMEWLELKCTSPRTAQQMRSKGVGKRERNNKIARGRESPGDWSSPERDPPRSSSCHADHVRRADQSSIDNLASRVIEEIKQLRKNNAVSQLQKLFNQLKTGGPTDESTTDAFGPAIAGAKRDIASPGDPGNAPTLSPQSDTAHRQARAECPGRADGTIPDGQSAFRMDRGVQSPDIQRVGPHSLKASYPYPN